jgi:hypothetical protein
MPLPGRMHIGPAHAVSCMAGPLICAGDPVWGSARLAGARLGREAPYAAAPVKSDFRFNTCFAFQS